MDTITRKCKSLIKFLLRIDGQDLIEYALLAAIISLGAVASLKGLATDIQTTFTNSGTAFTTAAAANTGGGGKGGH
ncbi:MAG: Flp family type IVb pilin [Acidobacteriaceae bacterium]